MTCVHIQAVNAGGADAWSAVGGHCAKSAPVLWVATRVVCRMRCDLLGEFKQVAGAPLIACRPEAPEVGETGYAHEAVDATEHHAMPKSRYAD